MISQLFAPIPKESRASLEREKINEFRSFAVLIVALGAVLATGLLVMDVAIDPVHAMGALPYRLIASAVLLAVAAYLRWERPAGLRTPVIVIGMIGSQAMVYLIMRPQENGLLVGSGAYLFWLVFLPLVGVGLTVRECLHGLVALCVSPLAWDALGWTPGFHSQIFAGYMWPAAAVVAVAIVLMDRVILRGLYARDQLSQAHEEARELARTDPLTNLHNRRATFELGDAVLRNAERYAHPVSALVIDLDAFKAVNDTYGHAAGDAAIRAAAALIRQTARSSDVTGRIGGEEFVVILPETALQEAETLAERLRVAIAETTVDGAWGTIRFTASIGLAERLGHEALGDLIRRADGALYAAKGSGRNRVAVAA